MVNITQLNLYKSTCGSSNTLFIIKCVQKTVCYIIFLKHKKMVKTFWGETVGIPVIIIMIFLSIPIVKSKRPLLNVIVNKKYENTV